MNTWTITCSLNALTISDARAFAAAIPAQDDHILQLRGRGYDLSYWWNKSNAQLVVHNLATDELITFDVESMDAEAQPDELYFDSIAVLPHARGKGLARQLLQYGIGIAREKCLPAVLACEPNNLGAKALYESLGFKHDGDLFIFGHHYLRMLSE